MFSVIIPLYNKELSISNTIQSVLDQTFQNFEIVIVNDGSTDNSVKEVEKFEDKRIRLIHQKNQGVSAARNRGIEEAKYEWIAFLDADDLWMKEHLEEYAKVVIENPQLSWVISGYTASGRHRKIKNVHKENGVLSNVFDALLEGLSIHTSTVCMRKQLFDKYHELYFRAGMNNSEDREVWYKLCCIDTHPYYISKSLSIYDTHVPDSLTKNNINTSKEHYLSMEERITTSSIYTCLSNQNRKKIVKLIRKVNLKAIKNRYVTGELNSLHKNHLPSTSFLFYNSTVKLPKVIKKIIIRML